MTLVVDISCKGSSAAQRVLLEPGDTLNVGRANKSLELSTDPRLSRKHFILHYRNREIEITHLSRTNPTLVASEGSTDFVEIAGKQVEPRGCRIIAGSHRFVAVIEAPDSIIAPTLSGDQTKIWSDVDSEKAQNPFCFDSFPLPIEKAGSPEQAPAQTTMPNPNIKPTSTPASAPVDPIQPPATPAQPVFSMDEPAADPPAAAAPNTPQPKPAPTPAPKTPAKPAPHTTNKKIFFPIEDDFFD